MDKAPVFIDLDRTLIARNSAFLWLPYALRRGLASPWQALTGLVWLLGYALGVLDISAGYRKAIRDMRGLSESMVVEATEDFFRTVVKPLYRAKALAAIEVWQEAGRPVVLLTSSSVYMAKLVTDDLGLDGFLASRYAVDVRGRYTGEIIAPLSYGTGKLNLAEGYVLEHGYSLADCAFYTDSVSDISVLERVGEPVAVNPDPALARRARRAGWRVVDWSA